MEVRRVFVDTLNLKHGLAIITGPMHKYIAIVLRKGKGGRIDLIDGKGFLYRCVVSDINSTEVFLKIDEIIHQPNEKMPDITMCVSPIKGPRMDWLIEKSTELGVSRIVPTMFNRTLIKCDGPTGFSKQDRWKRISIEALRQSGRLTVPEVLNPVPLRSLTTLLNPGISRIVLYEKESEMGLNTFFSSWNRGDVCVVIGPEGGIDDSEINWLSENGFVSYSLGENIFRSETTPLVVLSIIHYELMQRRNKR